MHVLHDNPVDGLFVLLVDARGFDELGLEAGYGLGVLVGVEVDGECVDHIEDVCGGPGFGLEEGERRMCFWRL